MLTRPKNPERRRLDMPKERHPATVGESDHCVHNYTDEDWSPSPPVNLLRWIADVLDFRAEDRTPEQNASP